MPPLRHVTGMKKNIRRPKEDTIDVELRSKCSRAQHLANGAIAVDAGLRAYITGARQSYRAGLALMADVNVRKHCSIGSSSTYLLHGPLG